MANDYLTDEQKEQFMQSLSAQEGAQEPQSAPEAVPPVDDSGAAVPADAGAAQPAQPDPAAAALQELGVSSVEELVERYKEVSGQSGQYPRDGKLDSKEVEDEAYGKYDAVLYPVTDEDNARANGYYRAQYGAVMRGYASGKYGAVGSREAAESVEKALNKAWLKIRSSIMEEKRKGE